MAAAMRHGPLALISAERPLKQPLTPDLGTREDRAATIEGVDDIGQGDLLGWTRQREAPRRARGRRHKAIGGQLLQVLVQVRRGEPVGIHAGRNRLSGSAMQLPNGVEWTAHCLVVLEQLGSARPVPSATLAEVCPSGHTPVV